MREARSMMRSVWTFWLVLVLALGSGGAEAGRILIGTRATIIADFAMSRSSCVAPCSAFFDAIDTGSGTASTQVTNVWRDVDFYWTFGEVSGPGVSTYTTGALAGVSSRNEARGPLAGHVWETPGTYTVTLAACNPNGSCSTKQRTFTVCDPDVFFTGGSTPCGSGGATVVVSTAGDFTGCPSGAGVTQTTIGTASFATAKANAGANKRLLFRAGETWTVSATQTIATSTPGPGRLGKCGAGADPIVQRDAAFTSAASTLTFSGASTPTMADWVIANIVFDHSLIPIGSHYALSTGGGIDQFMALRVTGKATGRVFLNTANVLDSWNGGATPGHHIWDQLSIVDCRTDSIPVGSAGTPATWPYGLYIGGERMFIAGNNFDLNGATTAGTSHVLRMYYAGKAVLNDNSLLHAGPTEHGLKLHGDVVPAVSLNGIGQGATRWVLASNNLFEASYGSLVVAMGPQSGGAFPPGGSELVNDVIFERNWVRYSVVPNASATAVSMWGSDQTARNNLLDMTNTNGVTGIFVGQRGTDAAAPDPSNVQVKHNTIYYGDTDNDMTGIVVDATATATVVKNNLGYAPNDSLHVMLSDSGVSTSASNNSSTAQMGATNPQFLGALSTVTNWGLSSGSYAKGAGASGLAVRRDFFGVVRSTTAPTLGAVE